MNNWLTQLQKSRIPYPQRYFLEMEIRQDLNHVGSEFECFTPHDLKELENVHCTKAFHWLTRFGNHARYFECFISYVPLILAVHFLIKEDKMIDFIRDGGAGMYAILAIGFYLLARELQIVFRLVLVKDHAAENLRLDTSSTLLGCLALASLGFGWSVMGVYVSINGAIATTTPLPIITMGMKESLTPLILSTLMTPLILLAHYGTRRTLHHWHVPLAE